MTEVDTPVEEVVRVGRGVCQDMAHLMIAIARRRGVAARYVSGWLNLPGLDVPGESHAWVELAIPGMEWVEFDPTHPEPAHEHYIRLALGRDYADAPCGGNKAQDYGGVVRNNFIQADDAALPRGHEPGPQVHRPAGQADPTERDAQQRKAQRQHRVGVLQRVEGQIAPGLHIVVAEAPRGVGVAELVQAQGHHPPGDHEHEHPGVGQRPGVLGGHPGHDATEGGEPDENQEDRARAHRLV